MTTWGDTTLSANAGAAGTPVREVCTLRQWSKAISAVLARFEVSAGDPAKPIGTLVTRRTNDVILTDLCSEPHVAQRSRPLPGERPVSLVCVQVQGTAQLMHAQGVVVLRPGDVGFYHSAESATLIVGDGYRSVCMTIPEQVLDISFAAMSGAVIPSNNRLAGVFADLVVAINDSFDSLSPPQRRRVVRSAVDLATALSLEELGLARAVDRGVRMREQLFEYIDEHLQDPDLNVQQLAVAHHISVRHVHNIFRASGETAAARIRSRRVERACQELADPRLVEVPVATIANRLGFASASHFGHLFKAAVGISPAAYRKTSTC